MLSCFIFFWERNLGMNLCFSGQCFCFTGGWFIFWEGHSLQPPSDSWWPRVPEPKQLLLLLEGLCKGAVSGHPLLFASSGVGGGGVEESILFIYLLFNPDWHRYVKACPSHAALQAVVIFRSSTRLQSSVDKLLRVCLNWRETHSLTVQQGDAWGCHMGSHSRPTYLRRK